MPLLSSVTCSWTRAPRTCAHLHTHVTLCPFAASDERVAVHGPCCSGSFVATDARRWVRTGSDVPPRMHPSSVTAQAPVQQTSFRTPRFSCWCAGSSAGAHSRCSGAQSRPPCGLRRSCSDLVSIARPNRTIIITSCVQAAPVGSSHGFGFASGHVFSWPSQDDNRGRVDGTTAAHAPAAQQVPILAAVCSCAQSRHVMCRLLRRSRRHLVLTARGHRTRAPASSLLRRQRSRCRLGEHVRTAVLIVPLHVIVAAHVQHGETESRPAVLERRRSENGTVR